MLPWAVMAVSAVALAASAWWMLGRGATPAATSRGATTSAVAVAAAASGAGAPAADAALPSIGKVGWLAGRATDWRVGWIDEHPDVLVIEFPGLAEQGAGLNRVAAFVEKAGAPRDRVLNDVELAQLIARAGDSAGSFYQGHDYAGEQLARFFNLAARQGQTLTAQERRLLMVLTRARLLEGEPPQVRPGAGRALVTFTAEQPDIAATAADETVDARRRHAVFEHELSHGRFITDAAYREHCRRFWREAVTPAQQERFRQFLHGLGYDRDDETLMINETQAFLMHTPDERAFDARAVGMTQAELGRLREQFAQALAPATPPRR